MPPLDERTEVDLRECVEGDGGIRVIRVRRQLPELEQHPVQGGHECQERRLDQAVDERGDDSAGWRRLCSYPRRLRADALYPRKAGFATSMGPGCKQSIENEAGDFIYIEPGVPHEVFNLSDTEPVVAVVARSDASEWENIVPYDRKNGSS